MKRLFKITTFWNKPLVLGPLSGRLIDWRAAAKDPRRICRSLLISHIELTESLTGSSGSADIPVLSPCLGPTPCQIRSVRKRTATEEAAAPTTSDPGANWVPPPTSDHRRPTTGLSCKTPPPSVVTWGGGGGIIGAAVNVKHGQLIH